MRDRDHNGSERQDGVVDAGEVRDVGDKDGDGVARAYAAVPERAGIRLGLAPETGVTGLILSDDQGDAVRRPLGGFRQDRRNGNGAESVAGVVLVMACFFVGLIMP